MLSASVGSELPRISAPSARPSLSLSAAQGAVPRRTIARNEPVGVLVEQGIGGAPKGAWSCEQPLVVVGQTVAIEVGQHRYGDDV